MKKLASLLAFSKCTPKLIFQNVGWFLICSKIGNWDIGKISSIYNRCVWLVHRNVCIGSGV